MFGRNCQAVPSARRRASAGVHEVAEAHTAILEGACDQVKLQGQGGPAAVALIRVGMGYDATSSE